MMDKKKAIENLKQFLSIIQKHETTGFRVKGNRNVLIDTKVEDFDIGYEITGDDNIAMRAEAKGPNREKIVGNYMYILGELEREKTDISRIRQLYEEIKDWAPVISQIILTILKTSNIIF